MLKAQNTIKITIPTLLVISSAICCYSQKPSPAGAESPLELAIERVGPPEFNAENNVVINISPKEKELLEGMTPIITLIGNTKDIESNREAVKNLSSIIEKYPEYSDAYFLRAMASILANDGNYHQVLLDVDAAINLHSDHKYSSAYDSTAPMYSLRAKVDLLAGDYSRTMNDLETAIKVDPSNEGDVFNTGGVKPEENDNPTALQKTDLESLVVRYPRDYRSFLFRGLFYASFTTYDEQYYAPALRDLEQARKLNPTSSMVNYFLGTVYEKETLWTKAGWADISDSGGYRDKTNAVALQCFEMAVKINPKFVEAQAEVAETLFSLKRYREAIPVYDKVIALDPNRFGAYNDRGLAKTYTNDYYGAISDFSRSIELKKTNNIDSSLDDTYENRADAYVKVGDFEDAVEDYST